MDFYEWLKVGVDNKWVTDVYCDTHDGYQMTDEEAKAWEDGEDPCIPVIRVW